MEPVATKQCSHKGTRLAERDEKNNLDVNYAVHIRSYHPLQLSMHPVKVPTATENLTTFSSRPQHKHILSQINTSAQQMRPFHNRGTHP